jgi:hypothetical protein
VRYVQSDLSIQNQTPEVGFYLGQTSITLAQSLAGVIEVRVYYRALTVTFLLDWHNFNLFSTSKVTTCAQPVAQTLSTLSHA